MKARVVLEVVGVRRQELRVERPRDLVTVNENVELAIAWLIKAGGCRALTVSVHVDGEGCDHE